MDLIAHPYVLDAKSSRQRLSAHEKLMLLADLLEDSGS